MGLIDVAIEKLRAVPKWVLFSVFGVITICVVAFIATTGKCETRAFGPILFNRSGSCDVKPAQTERSPPRVERVEILRGTDESSRLRAKYTLRPIDAEDVLKTAPTGTFGFAFAGTFASKWKSPKTLTIRNVAQPSYIEIQKRNDGRVYIIGYMRGDAADAYSNGPVEGRAIKMQHERLRPTDVLVSIPLSNVKAVGQDEVYSPTRGYQPVVELDLNAF